MIRCTVLNGDVQPMRCRPSLRMALLIRAGSLSAGRPLAIGPIVCGMVLVVWTERDEDVVRVIRARWATPREKGLYQRHIGRFL